jgi:hypothetical protein
MPPGPAATLAGAMGRRAPRRTEKEKHALVDAILDRGMSARQAVEAAAKGELEVPAFKCSLTMAKQYAHQARLRRTNAHMGALPEDEWLGEITAHQRAELVRRCALLERKKEWTVADARQYDMLIRSALRLADGRSGRNPTDKSSSNGAGADHSDLTPLELELLRKDMGEEQPQRSVDEHDLGRRLLGDGSADNE